MDSHPSATSKVKAMREKFNTPPGGKPPPLGPRPQIPKRKPPELKPKSSPANKIEATSDSPSVPVQTSVGTKTDNSKSNLRAATEIETKKSNPGSNANIGTTNASKPVEPTFDSSKPAESQEIMPKTTQLSVSKFATSANNQPAMSQFGSPKTNGPAEPTLRTPKKAPPMESARKTAPIEDDTSVILRKNSDKIPASDEPVPVAASVGKLNINKIFSENSFKPNIRTSNVVHSPSPVRELETELQKKVNSMQKGKFSESNNSKFPKRPSNRRSIKILTRKGDSRKFRKLEFNDLVPTFGVAPAKPPPLLNIDLNSIEANYRRSLLNTEYGDVLESLIEEDIDVTDNRISLIPTISAEDEGSDEADSLPSGSGGHLPSPSVPDHSIEFEGEMDDEYEPIDEVQEKIRQIKEKEKQDEKKNKELDKKAKKEKDKQMKTEQEKLRKEKEALKRDNKRQEEFKQKHSLSDSDTARGAGKIKATPKQAKNFDLNVREGEEVEIISMTGKLPMGKWIVRNEEGKYGYVDSKNIEVDIATIHSVMEGSYVNIPRLVHQDGGEVEAVTDELYEDVSN